MPQSLADFQQERAKLITEMSRLQDLRPGCITGIVRRCGKPTCHCARAGDPGHGPTLRLTYKADGKTISEALPSSAAVRKAEREISEFRRYQQLSRDFIEVNEKICRLRPVEDTLTQQEKNGRSRPTGSRPRSRSTAAHHFPRPQDNRPVRPGECRDRGPRRDASRRGYSSDATAAVRTTGCRSPGGALSVRPRGALQRNARQVLSFGSRNG